MPAVVSCGRLQNIHIFEKEDRYRQPFNATNETATFVNYLDRTQSAQNCHKNKKLQ